MKNEQGIKMETKKCIKCKVKDSKPSTGTDMCYDCWCRKCDQEEDFLNQIMEDTGCECIITNGEEFYY